MSKKKKIVNNAYNTVNNTKATKKWQQIGHIFELFVFYITCCDQYKSQSRLANLVVFLLCKQVVKSFIDRLVIVILHRPQVRLDQLQLVHLREKKQPMSHHISNGSSLFRKTHFI